MKKRYTFIKLSILFTLTTGAIYATNQIIHSTATIKNMLHKKQDRYYKWKFGNIHYTVKGEGSPVLLLHDVTPCSNTAEWKYIIEGLSKTHTVYCMDLLGCGCSDRPKMTYTNYVYVQLLTDFIKEVIKEKTDVITSGLSGSFAVMACKNDSSVIDRLIMINPEDLPSLNQIPTKYSKLVKYLLEIPLIGTLLYNIIMCRANIDLLFTEKYLFNPFHEDQELADIFYESAHLDKSNGKYLLASMKGKYIYSNITQAIKSINNSIFIIEGKAENRCKESIALYTAINPSIEHEIIPNTRHLPHMEAPDAVLDCIDIFLS